MHDNTFDALANKRRRGLLLAMLNGEPHPVGESAPTDLEQEVQVAMHHRHLPKLEDYGYIEWHEGADEVVRGPRFEEIQPLLEWMDDHAKIANRNSKLKS
jgi:hypothetical protein